MIGFIGLAVLLVVAVATAENRCPSDQSWLVEQLLSHEKCHKFYKCTFGQPIEQDCPAGLYFNDKTWQCDWAHLVDCGDRIDPAAPVTEAESDGNTEGSGIGSTDTDEADEGSADTDNDNGNTDIDGENGADGDSSNTDTDGDNENTDTDGNDGDTDGDNGNTDTDGDNDNTDTDGENDNTDTGGDNDNTGTDSDSENTDTDGEDDNTDADGEDNNTDADGDNDNTGTDGEDNNIDADGDNDNTDTDAGNDNTDDSDNGDSFLPNGCPVDPHVHWLLPHESDCNAFYYCVWGQLVIRNCAETLHFNPELQVCDWPAVAGCTTSFSKHTDQRRLFMSRL